MKTAIITISMILLLLLVFQIYVLISTQKSELLTYKVIREDQGFEIRHYPSATVAMITSHLKSHKELGNSGFKKLARYIFGGNKDSKQIAMTSPVYMEIGDTASSMSFVMPSNYDKNNLPLPNDEAIFIKRTPAEYVAAICFEGFASEEKIQKNKVKLERLLRKYRLPHYGSFRFLGYNPPYQLIGRKNEIIVSLYWNDK